jgi:hypothetical protein
MKTRTHFKTRKAGRDHPAPRGRNRPQGKKEQGKGRGGNRQRTEQFIEQPISDSSGTVVCEICGHPVDPQRMHPHMVRFHGVAIRSRGAWAEKSDSPAGKDG